MSVVAELVEKIEKLTLLEASELKKALEEKFGVSAAAVAAPAAAAGPAAAKGPKLVPASNLLVGSGTYSATVSAPRGTLPPVPNPSGGITGASISAVAGSPKITGTPGTFPATMIGSFVDDGADALLPDGSEALPLNSLFAVYPHQALAKIKAVAADGSSATLTQPATGTGTGATYVIAPVPAQVVLIQGVGGLPFIVDVYTPVTGGLCLGPLWGDAECGYDSGNLQWQNGLVLATAGTDGSLAAAVSDLDVHLEGGAVGVAGDVVAGLDGEAGQVHAVLDLGDGDPAEVAGDCGIAAGLGGVDAGDRQGRCGGCSDGEHGTTREDCCDGLLHGGLPRSDTRCCV